jgi:hypothetical protein
MSLARRLLPRRVRLQAVLLDIGAVWCHWCHVMDRESYDDPEVAAIVNDNYIAVKVDRDERPDIDSRYQVAVASLTRAGRMAAHCVSYSRRQTVLWRNVLSLRTMDTGGRVSSACCCRLRRLIATSMATSWSRRKWWRARSRGRSHYRRVARKVSASVIDAIIESARKNV